MDTHPPSVSRDHVLRVLRLHDVTVSCDDSIYILSKGDIIDAQALPERVSRHLLGRFAGKFGFSMGAFFASQHAGDRNGSPGADRQLER